jgi:membrane protein DedA with SNARE-associated domain
MIHGCCRRMLVGWCLFWLSASGWAVAQPAPMAPPAETLSHQLLEKVQHDIALVKPWLDRYGYGAVFVAVGVEGFGIPAPGETLLVAGALAAAGLTTGLNIGGLLLTAFLAAALGNSLGYWIGHRGGRVLLQRFQVDERHLQKIERGFGRYGGGLIVIARFFDGLRQLSGIAAGILKMPWWTFTLFNVLGAVLWVGCWGLGVYYLDEHLHAILAIVRRLNPWVATGTLLATGVLIGWGWLRWKSQNRAWS